MQTKNRKCLRGLVAGFQFEEPLWELRIGEWRIFYDVDEEAKVIVVRVVRLKETGKTTKEIV
ncbi:MAG: type II toxin-antitoxin system RelE/ParE family toxin [Deltaproteobacteria bacterium]|nr:type II toxin-antitoxin system RelE/ParE family toxin [Deltaproteobacteria bacterium]